MSVSSSHHLFTNAFQQVAFAIQIMTDVGFLQSAESYITTSVSGHLRQEIVLWTGPVHQNDFAYDRSHVVADTSLLQLAYRLFERTGAPPQTMPNIYRD